MRCGNCGSKKWVMKLHGSVCTKCRYWVPWHEKDMMEADWELVEKPLTNSGISTKGVELIKKALEKYGC